MITIETYHEYCEMKGITSHWKRQEICERSMKDVLSLPNVHQMGESEKHRMLLYSIASRIALFQRNYNKKTRRMESIDMKFRQLTIS
jgi:hypothetical protein